MVKLLQGEWDINFHCKNSYIYIEFTQYILYLLNRLYSIFIYQANIIKKECKNTKNIIKI